ncbi:hypothetical protein [Spirosoma oryzicola]|jgi:hypothetical protein|uniref:hypothetical protein n=1 Tax=Spirosoma oryzicola TaxID=2898794 RepID=UPI001E2E0CD5|nr:hypothetical protein [Spirosoma oryzicola]UHG93473.1 hypothetical protein LQ777_11335 [Spirosoma oryzicola]
MKRSHQLPCRVSSVRTAVFAVIFLLSGAYGFSQKVAIYSYGKPGTKDYEEIAFWVRSNNRAEINYVFGENRRPSPLRYAGKDVLNGEKGFKVQFTNKHVLYVIPKEQSLKISDLSGNYRKNFTWKYEGPVAGIGTFCEPCADDEKEAMQLIRLYYMK